MSKITSVFATTALMAITGCAAEELDDSEVQVTTSAVTNGAGRTDELFLEQGSIHFASPFGDESTKSGTIYCNNNSWVQGFKLQVEPNGGSSNDDVAMAGLKLYCYDRDGDRVDSLIHEWESDEPGWWSTNRVKCEGDGNFVTGARMRIEGRLFGSGDDSAANDLELACKDGDSIVQSNGGTSGNWSSWRFCPPNTFVCGMNVEYEPHGGSGFDDTGVDGLTLRCCQD
jgi:hypothetical protein